VKAAEMGAENVRFERADAESHDLPEGSFDAVLCSLGLMYVPDPVAALRAMRRLLKPGGRAVQAVWGERGRCGWAGIFAVVDARVETEVCPLFFQLGTGDALEAAMREAGFRDVRVERVRSRLFYMNAEEALGAAFVGGPVAMAYSRFEEAVRESAHAEYLESIEGFRVGAGYEIPGEFAVGYGVN
jgi:ubiquinone/menaquinone biosynthesis C-methylase UbiE